MNRISKTISVVIPTYNSWDTLKKCILSIQKQSLKPKEIIVIDNSSTDNTSEKVKVKFPQIKLVSLNKNTGVTGGRNMGIKKANPVSDYLLFLDHDMVADINMLKELVKIAQSRPDIGLVTPKIYYWGNRKRIWSAGTGINLWTGRIVFRGGEDKGQYENVEEVQVAPAAILVKRGVINKIKSFDDDYFVTYEDTDFCFRAREKKFKTFYAPKAVAYHILSWNPKDDADRVLSRSYWVGKNRVVFMKRFGKSFPIFSFFMILFVLYYLQLALRCNKFPDWLKFVQGTWEGLRHK